MDKEEVMIRDGSTLDWRDGSQSCCNLEPSGSTTTLRFVDLPRRRWSSFILVLCTYSRGKVANILYAMTLTHLLKCIFLL